MKYIETEPLRVEIEKHIKEVKDAAEKIKPNLGFFDAKLSGIYDVMAIIDSIQQEQSDKESLNESQQEFVNVVTERMLKEGPIPALKGKQKAEFEKEFNRFKQITGMINFPAHMEIYKEVILWFMAWGADNLPNLNKATGPDELDFQQEQPEVDLDKDAVIGYAHKHYHYDKDFDGYGHSNFRPVFTREDLFDFARHFYELGHQAKPEVFDTVAFQKGVAEGRRLEREDVKSTIQSRIDGILGDAQPAPILRMELQELIKKIEA